MSQILLFTISLLCLLYSVFILLYRYWWDQLEPFRLDWHLDKESGNSALVEKIGLGKREVESGSLMGGLRKFSVIIPARNEADNIKTCLLSILEGDYPKDSYDITVVDDYSTDGTAAIVQELMAQYSQIRILSLEAELGSHRVNAYKKKALELAISMVEGDWIVTTDADCVVPKGWLIYFDQYIAATGKKFVAAPVRFIDQRTFLSRFQVLDFLSLQGVTAAAVGAGFLSMCNGANLCYEKKTFHAVEGFKGIDQLASGDDMLLMHKMQVYDAGSTGYLFARQSIVSTIPMPDLRSFINQRVRWASKAGGYQDWKIKAVLLLVYLWNLGLFGLLVAGFFRPEYWLWWLGFLLIKFGIEWLFMRKVARFFDQSYLLRSFLIMQPFHILYTIIAGWLGLFGTYHWKDRKVK